eukprot:5486958-Pyramimonas_sp.AAC.1
MLSVCANRGAGWQHSARRVGSQSGLNGSTHRLDVARSMRLVGPSETGSDRRDSSCTPFSWLATAIVLSSHALSIHPKDTSIAQQHVQGCAFMVRRRIIVQPRERLGV